MKGGGYCEPVDDEPKLNRWCSPVEQDGKMYLIRKTV